MFPLITKLYKRKNIFIVIMFFISMISANGQSPFFIKKAESKKNAIEITLCNNQDSIVYIPKFSLRITAKEKCGIDYWKLTGDTLSMIFNSTASDCLQGDIVANKNIDSDIIEIKYRDIALKPNECCKQIFVLDIQIKPGYIKLVYDNYETIYKFNNSQQRL